MLLKTGVDISRRKPAIRKKLNSIAQQVSHYGGSEMVITSTYEGNHSPGSLHYADLAIDIRLPENPESALRSLRDVLRDDYDVIGELDHIHIEYDPKE